MTPQEFSQHPLGLAPLGYLDLAPPQLLEVASNAGFRSVGLRTMAAVPGGQEYPLHPGSNELEAIKEAMAKTGVTVGVVEVVSLQREVSISALRPMLECAASLGAKSVLCTGDDADFEIVTQRFTELCDAALTLGMKAQLEFMRFRQGVKNFDDAIEVVTQAGRPNGFVVLDVLHLMRSGGNVQSVVKRLEHVGVIQLCDGPLELPSELSFAEEARHDRLLPGEGAFPLHELLSVLPPCVQVDVEVPLSGERALLSDSDRAKLLFESARTIMAKRRPNMP